MPGAGNDPAYACPGYLRAGYALVRSMRPAARLAYERGIECPWAFTSVFARAMTARSAEVNPFAWRIAWRVFVLGAGKGAGAGWAGATGTSFPNGLSTAEVDTFTGAGVAGALS